MPSNEKTTSSSGAPTQPVPTFEMGRPARIVPAARTSMLHRNNTKWWLILLLLAVVLIIIVAIVSNPPSVFHTASDGGVLAPQTFHVGDHGQVVIKAHQSNVSVRPTTTDVVRIEFRNHNSVVPPDAHDVRVLSYQDHDAQGHDRLTISPDPWFKDIDFVVAIPSTLTVQITVDSGSLDIHAGQGVSANTSNGSITLEDIHGPIDVHTSSGDITANDVSGSMHIKAENGSLKLVRPRGEVNAVTSSGDVVISDGELSGQSVLQTQNGSVRFTGSLDSKGSYRMQTISGDVNATLPANAAFTLDAGTHSGSVQNAFGSSVIGRAPRPSLSMHTTNGSVVVMKGTA